MNAKVSIIICTYNRSDLLPKAIESILKQSFDDFEIIIIDDASQDNTKEIVERYINRDQRIKYFKNVQNLGIAASRNRGVSLAQGEYIAMLDSDDYWLSPDKLKKQVAVLESDREVGLIGTGIICVDENNNEIKKDIYETEDKNIRAQILAKNQFAQSSVLFRKKAFLEVGAYGENFFVCEDLDLWLAIGRKYKLVNLSEPLVAYLIHSRGISKSRKKEIIMTTDKIIDKYKKNYPNYFRAKFKSILRMLKFFIS